MTMEEATLMFRHLPGELSKEEKKDFLFNFGATRVHVMGTRGRLKHTAFAVFPSKDHATEVLHQLHQADLLGSTLVVEIARRNGGSFPSLLDGEVKTAGVMDGDGKGAGVLDSEKKNAKMQPREIKFDETFGVWGLKQPRRPELRYRYPAPTPSILTNIMNALVALPKFYVQVLHLMNKMDLPTPFGAVTPAPPMIPSYAMPDDIDQKEMDISSSEGETESEMESDEESKDSRSRRQESKDLTEKARRRHKDLKKLIRTKRPRLSEFQQGDNISSENTASVANVPISDVFEQMPGSTTAQTNKKMALNFKLPTIEHSDGREQNWQPEPQRIPAVPLLPTASASSSLGARASTLLHDISDPSQSSSHRHHQQHRQHQSISQHPPQHPPLPTQDTHQEGRFENQSLTNLEDKIKETASQSVLYSPSIYEDNAEEDDTAVNKPAQSSSGFGTIQHTEKGKEDSRVSDLSRSEDKDEGHSAEQDAASADEKFISSSTLRRGKLTKEEMRESSVFRRYNPGEASCRLYIKNVARHVTEADLRHIYGRYVDWESDTDINMFDIRLMKEGRMKGQSFVTLPSQEVAMDALKDTNGFVLKDKPLVVQFARSAKAQEDAAAVKS